MLVWNIKYKTCFRPPRKSSTGNPISKTLSCSPYTSPLSLIHNFYHTLQVIEPPPPPPIPTIWYKSTILIICIIYHVFQIWTCFKHTKNIVVFLVEEFNTNIILDLRTCTTTSFLFFFSSTNRSC